MDGLDNFLKGSEQPEAEIETPEVPETQAEAVETPPETAEEPKGPVRDDKGRFAPKGETEGEPPAPIEEPTAVPLKALQEERRKRQELEQRLALLEQPPQPAPTIWEDEQGWQQNLQHEVVNTAVQQASLNARLDMSEMMVRQSQPDFEDKKAKFIELMNETPGLQQKAISDPHPWNFAYQYVSNHERMQQLSAVNVADLEAKLREQIRAELTAPAPTPPVPDTLADQQSSRGSSADALKIPSFNEILKR